jgi:hypothetical protein
MTLELVPASRDDSEEEIHLEIDDRKLELMPACRVNTEKEIKFGN